jgi:hypothetical protein
MEILQELVTRLQCAWLSLDQSSISILAAVAVAPLFTWLLLRWQHRAFYSIPSPWGDPITGNGLAISLGYIHNAHEKFLQWHEQLGSIVRIRVFHRDIVLIADPKVANDVLGRGPNACPQRAPEYTTFDLVRHSR